MNWKSILIVGLGILSIVVLYYCYKRYYNEEGFQEDKRTIRTETFIGSSALTRQYMFSGSIITLREIYSQIIRFLTDYRNYSGYADANMYTYYSNKYKKNLTIVDFSYYMTYSVTSGRRRGQYWFPYTGQYGTSSNWLSNFSQETSARIDLDIYNNNLSNYISFIKKYSANNKQKFIFNRSLLRPSLLYRGFDLTQPPTFYNLRDATTNNIIDTEITRVAGFNSNSQSWLENFKTYAVINKNLYPASDDQRDTLYRVFYTGSPVEDDKPPNRTYSNINDSKKAGEIVNLLPDRRRDIINEELELNVYGGEITTEQINDFKECMFLGSVFTNFDDQYNIDTLLRVPYNGIINGANAYYSFNMFLPELTPTIVNKKLVYLTDSSPTGSITYNTSLVNLRSGNTIKKLSDTDLNVDNITFISKVKNDFQSKTFTQITNSNEAYVGNITSNMMAKIPSLARRYITSWVFNRSTRYLGMHVNDVTGSGLNENELIKAQYICLAVRNFSGSESLDDFLSIYTKYASYTTLTGTFTSDATISNVPNEDTAKKIVASSRIYNTYQYSSGILQLSKSKTGGNLFNKGVGTLETSNYFRDAEPSRSITGDLISALTLFSNNIGQAVLTFPTDSIKDAKGIIDSLPSNSIIDPVKILLNTTYLSIVYVKSIIDTINSSFLNINDYLSNSFIDNAMILIKEINKIGNTITTNELFIQNIIDNGNYKTINLISINNDYSIGDYISISGTTNYNGRLYKILSINTSGSIPSITISSSKTGNQTFTAPTWSGRVNKYSLDRYLAEAQTNINSLISTIPTTLPEISLDRLNEAKKNIELNKTFIDFFLNNIVIIKNSIDSMYKSIDIIQMINKIIVEINSIATWNSTLTYDINEYVKIGTIKYKSIKVNTNILPPNATYWLELTDYNIKSYMERTITDISGAINSFSDFFANIDNIKNNSLIGDKRYIDLENSRNSKERLSEDYEIAQMNLDNYLSTLPQYITSMSIISTFTNSRDSLDSLYIIINNIKTNIGTGSIADSMAAPTELEIKALISDFNILINKNKLIPNYGNLSNLNITDPSFLNSIAQLYYESSDGLYEMTTIYDVYMVGSNSVDIRFDKKQRLPKGRINNLSIQYLPQIQEYNRLLDIMEDGSWINYYKDVKYISNGQTLTSNAYDFYYQALSTATSKLDPILNPIYPVDQSINVKDLQIELSNLNTSNDLITKILTGKLKGTQIPYIGETQETVGYNYTDRILTIQYSIQDKMYKIENKISGILQGCARVFVTPTQVGTTWNFPINGMAIGVNAALSYNLAYNGNLEIDMANTQGNIGQYYPTILYTKNLTPPIVCGDVQFINKAVSLFNQTAFLNLSSFTSKITGDDLTKRQQTETSDVYDFNINARKDNFYDSNDGPLYVDKILGFQQVNENTCYYKWQETQYDPLTNGVFTTDDGVKKQRIKNVRYQFIYDNVEYQNPRLIPDNNPRGIRPNEGFVYLSDNISILFGDLYLSLYSWYAAATRDLYIYLNEINNKYTTLYTPQYTTLVSNYNTQSSNLSNLNKSTIALFSTNLVIANSFTEMFKTTTVTNSLGKDTCDSIKLKPPTFSDNYNKITYNFRPGDGNNLTSFDGSTYNKFRTVDIKDFFNDILNNDYQHTISKCDNAIIDPENCFTADIDKCKYTFPTSSEIYRKIESNIAIRDNIRQAISNTNEQIRVTVYNINSQLSEQTQLFIDNDIVRAAGRSIEHIYPEISNINNQITSLINERSNTQTSIDTITTTYSNLLQTQTSDSNLPIYVRNQVIPIIKPLPEEAYSLDTQYGQCPSYTCTSPIVMNSLVEQYNLDKDYDDTITSIIKGATPNPFQCDYLVEVRKKNAIVTNSVLQFNIIKFTPIKPSFSDNRSAIYFPGNKFIKVVNSCINLGSNNFTIDWFQYPVFDSENPNPFVFSYGENKNLSVQFFTNPSDNSTIRFTLYTNGSQFLEIDLNHNQLDRWSYFAVVRYNNVITCYKDGFAILSKDINVSITNSSNVYIGNDNSRIIGTYFKGGMRNFSFNNYDALYNSGIFNTVPIIPIKNINTKFILNENIQDVIDTEKIFINTNVSLETPISPSISQTYLTNGGLLREIFRGNNQNNSIAIDSSSRIYISDTANHIIKRRESNGTYTTVVGTGIAGRSITDIRASEASLSSPSGICFGDTLYIADTGNNRICYIQGDIDDRLYELVINIRNVSYIAYYSSFLYYVNSTDKSIGRKQLVYPYENTISYIILPATSNPSDISFDNLGNLYIADPENNCIYQVLYGSTTATRIITGLNRPLSVTADLLGNLYIANGDNRIYMAKFNNPSYTITHIAGDGTASTSFNEGYARMISLVPQRVLYHSSGLYVVDSRRICYVEMANRPSAPSSSGKVYRFNSSSIKINSLGEVKYKFNKNLFTIQWFMLMEGNGSQTIFTFENGNKIQLGVIFDIGYNSTKMNLYINERVYPYNSETNISTPIELNNSEIVGLWVHIGIVHNGSTLSIYKNSILLFSLNSTSFSFNSINSQLTIGNRLTPTIETSFRGQMRSFIIYNKLAKNYNNTIEEYTNSSFTCAANLVLHLSDGTNSIKDLSIGETDIYRNFVRSIESYPYGNNYNPFKIKLYYSNNTTQEIEYSRQVYDTPFITNLGTLKSITSFNIYSLSYENSVQQWLLEGSSDGTTWYMLHQQLIPYTSRSSPIYPKDNSYSSQFPIVAQRNIGGDIVKMTKSFQLATIIDDCSYVITSNYVDGEYTKGVTSSNAFFIQDNTPYVQDTSGSDVSGFQFIGNLLGDYQSNIQSLYDPIISDSSNILLQMSNKYKQSESDTYGAVGKLNTLNFYSSKFNKYDSLRNYMNSNVRFTNTIFDGYFESNSYMSNILRFYIVDSSNIDIVFNKVDLTGLTLANIRTPTTYNFANRTTTAAARYSLFISKGFLDLTATFLSNVIPTSNIFNDDFTSLTNPRNIDYKDRLNQRAKLVAGVRTPDASVASFTIAITPSETERLTGLTGIIGSNILPSPAINTVEYMLSDASGTLPISKTNYIVQYKLSNEVNSVIPATLDNTSFKISISAIDNATLITLINNFKTYFNRLYQANTDNGYPYSSILIKVYKYSILNNILYISCGIEYTKIPSTTPPTIYYNKIPNIKEFGTEEYYKVGFKTGNNVLAFEPCSASAGGTLIDYIDSTNLLIGETTQNEIKNKYKKNILWTQIKFIPTAAFSERLSYSISQIEFFNSALNDRTKPVIVRSLSINGGNVTNFNFSLLIDGDNTRLRNKENMNGRFFTHTYVGGEITATFKEGTYVDGFSFMTGYSLTNPDKWVVKGTTDGITWIDLVRQDTNYIYSSGGKDTFYRTPIFSFVNDPIVILNQSGVNSDNPTASINYNYLRITPKSSSLNYQLTNIRLFNNNNVALANTTTTDPTDSSRNLSYLFDRENLNKTNPIDVKTYENVNDTPLIINFTSPISFNGIFFISGIDVNKCIVTWKVEASQDNISWNTIYIQEIPYTNDTINYPHFFCRTPIFYSDSQTVETTQEKLYNTKFWPIRYVRFKPFYMYGTDRGETFEVSHFDFFNSSDNALSLTSITNNNLLRNINSATLSSELNIFRGDYFDSSTNHIDFEFTSVINFDGFSFMSGSDINNCVQLWTLEVSINGTFWVIAHSTNNIPYTNNNYPSPYYRLPIIFFNKNNILSERIKYYIISNNTIYNIEIYISRFINIDYINFVTIDGLPDYSGMIFQNNSKIAQNENLILNIFNSSTFSEETITYTNIYPLSGQAPSSGARLYKLISSTGPLVAVFNNTFIDNSIKGLIDYNDNGNDPSFFPTTYSVYTNIISESGILFNTNSIYYLDQISSWRPPIAQGFTNYSSINYIDKFLLVTNRTFNSKLFKLIGSDNKVIPKIFYTVESNSRNTIVYLKAYIEIIGYTIKTGLYSPLSDADSWKVYGIKKNKWILLDRQDNYNIPVERSYTLPPFYFNKKSSVIAKNNSIPDIKMIEDYYTKKINPFGKAVFKQYMFDNNKTYYMVFDEYDNNRNLIDTDLIIGFVIVKGLVKKPVMYENQDGSFDAFNLKKKEMMAFWKKKIGLNLETKYLSDY